MDWNSNAQYVPFVSFVVNLVLSSSVFLFGVLVIAKVSESSPPDNPPREIETASPLTEHLLTLCAGLLLLAIIPLYLIALLILYVFYEVIR